MRRTPDDVGVYASRRAFLGRSLGTGLAALTPSLFAGAWRAPSAAAFAATPSRRSHPILPMQPDPDPAVIGGLRFAPRWFGDVFPKNFIPFHQCESCEPSNAPDEFVDVAIVGGGLSGLASAYHLREAKPVVFELKPRFGGNAVGESWDGVPYSLGSAYVIVPDRGSRIERLYDELGILDDAHVDRQSKVGGLTFEWQHVIGSDPCVAGCNAEELLAVERYRERVRHFAFERFPEIPLPGGNAEWIKALDGSTLEGDIAAHCGALPPAFRAAVQAYCYSSFGVGWGQLSAAAGWNFLAAEEYGRLVLPGGNATLAGRLYERLVAQDASMHERLRAGALVESVRLVGDRVHIRWRSADGTRRTLSARYVVMANAKHLVERMIEDLPSLDREKADAVQQVFTSAYVVANVLVRRPVRLPVYDTFLIHDPSFPMDGETFEGDRRVVDLVDGTFGYEPTSHDVLTFYWPLPFASGRFTIVGEEDWQTYAELGAPQLRRALRTIGVAPNEVAEIRLARFGHAMPIAAPNAIASGIAERVRRPIADRIYFVNQDNWLLPAVETCLEEAFTWTDEIRARLS